MKCINALVELGTKVNRHFRFILSPRGLTLVPPRKIVRSMEPDPKEINIPVAEIKTGFSVKVTKVQP